jgi:redox-sensitive bicupin YhaK (pirin superfamily)
MIQLRRAEDRGYFDHGWLRTFHTFSFADYYDPNHMGFRGLRVINEDYVQPGRGFGTHPHRDMEIVTYVLEGELEHRDSMGNGSIIRPGEVQRMSAGSGITHSEFNASKEHLVHLLQIWVLPSKRDLEPSYEQKTIDQRSLSEGFQIVASPKGSEGSVTVHSDVRLYVGRFESGSGGELAIPKARHAWVHIARGQARVNGHELSAGDGAALSLEPAVKIQGTSASEVLVFDLA